MENTKKVEILTEIKNQLELDGIGFTCNICKRLYNKEGSLNDSEEFIWYSSEIRGLPVKHRKLFLELLIDEDLSEFIFAGRFNVGIPFDIGEINLRLKMLNYLIKHYSNEKNN